MVVGELIPETLHFMRDNPVLRANYMFDHVLVDEYQDLNTAEQTLLDLLADVHARHLVKAMETRPPAVLPLVEDAIRKEFLLREVVRGSQAQQERARGKYRAWLRHVEAEREKAGAALPDSTR